MSYSEENGQVMLRMSRPHFMNLLMFLGIAAGALGPESPMFSRLFNLQNVLNEGNPNYTPYQVPEKK